MTPGSRDEPPWTWSATEIVKAVADGSTSCVEVVTSCLERIAAVNPLVNAVVDVDQRGALDAAAVLDRRRQRGEQLGDLAGVPVLTKANVDQRGRATTNGVAAFHDRIASDDNPVIANLRHADAVIVGRTTVPAFSWRWFTDSELYGRTVHPTNPDKTVGGSSGGAAVAVATGMVPIAHGSDLAGSIRYPALACGVLGLRPSLGRVPSFDATAPTDRPPFAQLLGSQGPLARTSGDLRLALRAMARESPLDPWATPSLRLPRTSGPCRVALVRDAPWADVDPVVSSQVDLAAARLEAGGYTIEEITPPGLESTLEIYRALLWEASHGLLRQIEQHGDEAIRGVVSVMQEIAAGIDATEYFRLFGRRTALARSWGTFLQDCPLILMPVSWQRPFPADYDQRGPDAVRRVMAALEPSIAVNICGLPALAAPTDRDEHGPLGVQLVAGRFQEERLLEAAELLRAADIVSPLLPHPA